MYMTFNVFIICICHIIYVYTYKSPRPMFPFQSSDGSLPVAQVAFLRIIAREVWEGIRLHPHQIRACPWPHARVRPRFARAVP